MKLAWVKAGRLLPVDTGGKLRSFNLLKELRQRHDLTVLTYYDGAHDASYERDMNQQFPGAVSIATGARHGSAFDVALRYTRALPSAAPFSVEKWTHAAVRHRVQQWMRTRTHDVIVCDFLAASNNFPRQLDIPTVLFQHNVETELWRRQATVERNPLRRAVFQLEARKMAHYERAVVSRFHHVIAVSEHDRALMSRLVDERHITVVPTGVDIERFTAAVSAEPRTPLVMYLGSMDWEPNVDGVEWFAREMWPRVRTAVPTAQFRIVGRDPVARVRALASDTITVTGSVPSVVEHLAEAAVLVVPLRIGGGTRLKILEAMGAARAVVSTRIGAEGLDVTHDDNILLHDTAADFAEAVITVLRDDAKRKRLAANAKRTAERYDWSSVVREFELGLTRAIAAGNGHGQARGQAHISPNE